MRTLLLSLVFSVAAFGQCGILVLNPTTFNLDCTGPTGGVTTTAGATFGAFTYDFTASTVSLPVVFVRTDTSSTNSAGVKWTFGLSSTTAGLRLTCGSDPSSLSAGDLACTTAGGFEWHNGTALGLFTNPATAKRTWTMQDASYTVIGRDTTDTLANKSMSGASNTFTNIPQSAIPTDVRGLPFSIGDPGGSALTAASTTTDYLIDIPFACTITGYSLGVDAGTVTVKFWRKATGTAIPTVSDVISTSGVSISSGTRIRSTTVSDFTSTAVAANDVIAMNVTAVATAKYVTGVLECTK